MKHTTKRKGFTVVELVIVIAVVAVLAAVMIPAFSGIMQSAHVSNDTQIAATMTTQLKIASSDAIVTEAQLKKAIDTAYGDTAFFENLTPKSASYGYHYWFDIVEQKVIVAKPNELTARTDLDAATEAMINTFATGAPRTAIENGYYLMDRAGSPIVEEIVKVEVSGEKTLADLNVEGTAYAGIANVVDTTVVLTQSGANGATTATTAYVSPFVGQIGGSGISEYTALAGIINIPAGVIVKEDALSGANANVTVNVDAPIVNGELPELEPGAVDEGTKITVEGKGEYTVDEDGTLSGTDENGNAVEVQLGYAVEVEGVTITVDGAAANPGDGPIYFDKGTEQGDILYIAVTHTAGVKLTALPTNENASSKLFTWSIVDGAPFTLDGDTLTRKAFADLGVMDEFVITATPRAGGASKSITVRLVKPTNPTIKVNGVALTAGSVSFNYDGTGDKSYATVATPNYNYYYDSNGTKASYVTFTGITFSYAQTAGSDDVFGVDAATGTITLPAEGSCTGTQEVTVTCGTTTEAYVTMNYTVQVTDISGLPFEKDARFANKNFLFRVGNSGAIALDYFFDNDKAPASINVAITNVNGTADATVSTDTITAENWKTTALTFSGKGVACIEIKGENDAVGTTFYVEVVDGTNVTKYSELKNKNSVLLADITMSSGGSYSLSNATLYGNGFTFDVKAGTYAGSSAGTTNYLVGLTSANLDNVKLVGAVYNTFNINRGDNYNRALVITSGNCGIYNSYLSGCASPVRTYAGNVEIENTTLAGGAFANLDIRNGQITLRNVITINQADLNDKASDGKVYVGLGIVAWYEQVLSTTTLTIDDLTQYNHMKSDDNIATDNDIVSGLFKDLFKDTGLAKYRYENTVNTSILSLQKDTFNRNNVLNKSGVAATPSGCSDAVEVSLSSYQAVLWPRVVDATTLAAKPDAWKATAQAPIAPEYSFDHTVNDKDKEEGSNDYCYENNGVIYISMDEGDSLAWLTSILTVTKNGETIIPTVTIGGVEYPEKYVFENLAAGTHPYTVVFTYIDANNYKANVDSDGNVVGIVDYQHTYTKTVTINVSVVKAAAKNAEFDFNGNGVKKVTIGNITYIMPNVTATSSTIGSKIVNGQTVYYPIVTAYTNNGADNTATTCYMCFPVFKGVITITDYADGGAGDAVVYNGSTQSKPANLSVVTGKKQDGTPQTVGDVFIYASASPAANDPVVHNKVLVYQSPALQGVERLAQEVFVEYQYQDNKGTVYRYYVSYSCPALKKNCVTGDTLITLADGTQKRVDELTGDEMLLVWNHTTGALDVAPIAYIVDHGRTVSEHAVLALTFSDGSVLEMIGEHVFYDKTLSKYVAITPSNVGEYIGHTFVANNGEDVAEVLLVSAEEYKRETGVYEVVTYQNISCFTNGILSASAYLDRVLNIFDIDADTMAYDAEQVAADIEKYGLYTYEDFADLVPEEAFDLYNAAYLKVAVGKGYITWDDILELISIYFDTDVTPLQ